MAGKYDAKDIDVLEGLEPVRLRPGMYIGNTGRRGLNHLINEIFDNSVDEGLSGYCTQIEVIINKDGSATITDNGRGVPVDMHKKGVPAERVIYTYLHAGGKFRENTYKIRGGLHGVGGAVVNALSKEFRVTIWRDGYEYYDSYAYGKPTTKLIDKELPKKKIREKKTGTSVTFYPDETIFETTRFKADAIKQRLKETSYLNPNLTIIFRNERDGKEPVIFHEPGGIEAFVKDVAQGLTITSPVISYHGEENGIEVDVAMLFTEDGDETCIGFCNNITNPEGGTHLAGFKTAFAKLINDYSRNDLGLLKEKDSNLNGSEIRNGLCAIISVKHPDPQFEGQTKQKLSNSDAAKAVENVTKKQLTVYFDRNYEVLKGICERAVDLAKKKASDKNRAKLDKLQFEGNGKLAQQESRNPAECEIFIVEGDSAGGTAKTARNRKTQAVLPLRGKILNVEKAGINKILENAEIRAMITYFGTGIQDGFDINKLKYDKIIIMTDADVDGSHIDTLLLTFFYRFMPELITEGHVYVAVAPLYGVKEKGKWKYFYSDRELEKYRKKNQAVHIQRYKGLGEMDADQLFDTTMDPDNRRLQRVSIGSMAEANSITSILMGNNVEMRKEYIFEHGREAVIDN